MSDMQAEMATRLYKPTIPCMKIVPNVKIPPPIASVVRRVLGLKYFSKKVQMKRLVTKIAIATIL
jgi:hypothetical protein